MTPQDCQAEIIQKTTGEIQTFLDELANGTSNYKSLHNLTEQVEHQYHNRFLVELIQNAHDAMNECDDHDNKDRLEILIVNDEAPYGSLYVANDGQPFTRSNFESLSKLGQSDKDPEKSIGNKGIGFRSVLEITTSPEIYSRSTINSKELDGYCFKFTPDVTKYFEAPIRQLLKVKDNVLNPLDEKTPLVDWGSGRLNKFRRLHGAKDDQWLKKELSYLSPYLLPIPINGSDKTTEIKKFEEQGFASVIRLPFKSESARTRAIKATENLDENTILFLNRVKSLSLNVGDMQRLVERKVDQCDDPHGGQFITLEVIENGAESYAKKKYMLWTVTIGGEEKPEEREEIEKAVAEDELPGRWPEVTKAKVSLAVRTDSEPDKGLINIYLPTQVPTGCAAHFNGPFYGDMSRTNIDFGKKYNELILKRIGRMAVEVILESLAGKDVEAARAIIDILSPSSDSGQAGIDWFKIIKAVCEKKDIQLNAQPIMLTDEEWTFIGDISLIPEIEAPRVLTPDYLREQATFDVIHKDLMNRKNELKALFNVCQIEPMPLDQELAATVENIAAEIHKTVSDADWNGFWYDLIKLFKSKSDPLKGKKIILGNDGELHASGDECTIFFPPRQGVDDDEVQTVGTTSDIPQTLREHIAFLSDGIEIYNPLDERQQTPIRKYLESTLVERFRVMEIFRSVLIPKIPTLPVSSNSPQSRFCRDILLWALKMVAGMPDRGKGKTGTLQLLQQIPVPCHGGWYPMSQVCFGPNWSNTAGQYVYDYLKGANTKECQEALGKMLLPPADDLWEGKGEQYKDLLMLAGVFDGLKLLSLEPGDWKCVRSANQNTYRLPDEPPPCIPIHLWNDYKEFYSPEVRKQLNYVTSYPYEVKHVLLIPGLQKYEEFNENTRIAFMNALFASMERWDELWHITHIQRTQRSGINAQLESPLSYCLKYLPWIAIDSDGAREWYRPYERWYIPKNALASGIKRYGHLKPLPGTLADKLDQNPPLYEKGLARLGMPKFLPDAEGRSNDVRLLNALVAALESEISDPNMFLNHIRIAWKNYSGQPINSFPEKIIISVGQKQFKAVKPDISVPVYLPDSSESFVSELGMFSLPVVEILTPDAKDLAYSFKMKFGDAICLTSDLKVWPIVEGQHWQLKSCELLSESELSWLPAFLIAICAYVGSPPPGLYAKKISDTVQQLRNAHICWVPSLKAGLWKGDDLIVEPPIPAMWLADEDIIICDENYKDQLSQYVEAFKNVIERDDLELPLKHALEKIKSFDAPTHDDIQVALDALKIKPDDYDQACDLWQGDFGKLIRMTMPVVALLKPASNIGTIIDMNNEGHLKVYLEKLEIPELTPQEIISFIQSSSDYYILGMKLYEKIGETAQLHRWNQALARVDVKQLINRNAEEEFRNQLESANAILLSLLRHIMLRQANGQSFEEISSKLESIPLPEDLKSQLWEVEFEHALQCTGPFFENLNALSDEIAALKNSKTIEDLGQNLLTAKVEIDINPIMLHRKNHEIIKNVLTEFIKIALAACIKENIGPLLWEKSPDDLLVHFEDFFKHRAYLNTYSDHEYFELIRTLPRDAVHTMLWNAVDQATDIQSLMKLLSLSAADIASADEELEKYKDKKRKQNRLTRVADKEFDYAEENLSQLWDHIIGQVDEVSLLDINLQSISLLAEIGKRKKREPKPGEKKPRKLGRTSKEMEHLIGFAGEINAYRMLKKKYGDAVVHPGTWKSSYGQKVFPRNNPDDNIGCDFIINQNKITYYIEVKASMDENDSFELGSSEIRKAMELVKRKKRHVFMIMHVQNALSKNPTFRLLPNPYDPRNQGIYSVEDAGARIRYRMKK